MGDSPLHSGYGINTFRADRTHTQAAPRGLPDPQPGALARRLPGIVPVPYDARG
ncbi:hypothetical protein OML25_08980 [Stutzerimonas stutzeri]|nr:hypothetical protein OML25_08980 [Stutzerimonas stutzeri]